MVILGSLVLSPYNLFIAKKSEDQAFILEEKFDFAVIAKGKTNKNIKTKINEVNI